MSETIPAPANVIAWQPPKDGHEWDCQCARCGSSMDFEDCWRCGGDGWESREDEDPLWYDPEDLYPCPICHGAGGWQRCLSTYGDEVRAESGQATWCEANPMLGRESQPSMPEWFVIRPDEDWVPNCIACGERIRPGEDTCGALECGGKRLPVNDPLTKKVDGHGA